MNTAIKILEKIYNLKLQEVNSDNFPITEQDRIWYFVESDTEPTYTTYNEFLKIAKEWIFSQGYSLEIYSVDGRTWEVTATSASGAVKSSGNGTEFEGILDICNIITTLKDMKWAI